MQIRLNTIVAAAVVMFGSAAYAQDMVVKIGHVGPTSGGIAHLGKDNENGARMAIDELNAKGVTIGGKKVKFELLAEDDGADPKQGTAAAQKLVDSKVNGVVGHQPEADAAGLQDHVPHAGQRQRAGRGPGAARLGQPEAEEGCDHR